MFYYFTLSTASYSSRVVVSSSCHRDHDTTSKKMITREPFYKKTS